MTEGRPPQEVRRVRAERDACLDEIRSRPPPRGRRVETCPVSTGGGTRRVQLVREEGRDVSN